MNSDQPQITIWVPNQTSNRTRKNRSDFILWTTISFYCNRGNYPTGRAAIFFQQLHKLPSTAALTTDSRFSKILQEYGSRTGLLNTNKSSQGMNLGELKDVKQLAPAAALWLKSHGHKPGPLLMHCNNQAPLLPKTILVKVTKNQIRNLECAVLPRLRRTKATGMNATVSQL